MKPVDETAILRFASGEMDADEEATLLARCELAPDAWRTIALAVAEHRRVIEVLGEWAAMETNGEASAAETDAREAQTDQTSALPASGHLTPRHSAWPSLSLVAAGSLAVGLLLGIVGARATALSVSSEATVAKAQSSAQLPRPVVQAASVEPSSPLPLELFRIAPMIPAAQRAALNSHGFRVDEEPTVYVITAKNGTRWAVPTQRATLSYVKQSNANE